MKRSAQVQAAPRLDLPLLRVLVLPLRSAQAVTSADEVVRPPYVSRMALHGRDLSSIGGVRKAPRPHRCLIID